MNYARIRVGALVYQENRGGTWPNLFGGPVDPDTVFAYTSDPHQRYWTLRRRGCVDIFAYPRDLRKCEPPRCETCGQELPE